MAKLLLLSVLIALFAIPIRMARDPNPRRGFKRALLLFFAFCLVYVGALRFFYQRLL